MTKLKLVSIQINNVLGVTELEINPTSNIIEVSGRNGQGKTSIMESVKSAVGVSDYSTLLRNGEKKGTVVLDLGDMSIQKTYKENGETLKIEGKVAGTDTMSTISRPSSVLKTLINPDSVDPVRLLTCKPKELLNAVLGAIPMTVEPNTLGLILGVSPSSIDVEEHALIVLGKHTARITEERKLINRDGKQAKITAEQLNSTLPESIPLTEEIQGQIDENLVSIEGIRTSARKASRAARQAFDEPVLKLTTQIEEYNQYIEEQENKLATAKEERYKHQVELQNLEALRKKSGEDAMEQELDKGDEYQNHNVELSKEIAGLKVFESTQAMVKDWKNKEATATKSSNILSQQLVSIQKYKTDLCSDLPIEGLTIEDGLLSFNKIPFQTLNTAARVGIVLELAKLSAGKLGLVVIDNSECMDQETYNLFLKEAAKTDLTFVVGRVTNEDLAIK